MQLLPIAAAHHPSFLRKLRPSILAPPQKFKLAVDTSLFLDATTEHTKSHADTLLSVHLYAEKRMTSALQEALARTRTTGEGLQVRLIEMQKGKSGAQSILNLRLDNESQHKSIDFTVSAHALLDIRCSIPAKADFVCADETNSRIVVIYSGIQVSPSQRTKLPH